MSGKKLCEVSRLTSEDKKQEKKTPEKIELYDGTILEVKSNNKWLESSQVSKAFRNIIAATRIEKTSSILRFFFIHKSYFRAFEEFGLPLMFMPIVTNYHYFNDGVADSIKLSKEKAKEEFSEFSGNIFPIIISEYITPFVNSLREKREQPTGLSEKDSEEAIFFKTIGTMKRKPIANEVKKFVKYHVSPEIFTHALSLGKIGFRVFLNSLVETGVKQYECLAQEFSSNKINLLEKTTDALIECNVVTPIGTIIVCANPHCRHIEVTISDIIPKKRCTKCKNDALLITSAFINEPYLQIKEKMLDLHTIIFSYIKSRRNQEYTDGKLVPSLRCFLTAYVRKLPKKDEAEVDVLIYSNKTRKVIPVEIKIHQIRNQLPNDRLMNILKNDLQQFGTTLKKLELEKGYFITNLIISDEQMQGVKENLIPTIFENVELKIISALDETRFLDGIDYLIKDIEE